LRAAIENAITHILKHGNSQAQIAGADIMVKLRGHSEFRVILDVSVIYVYFKLHCVLQSGVPSHSSFG
jgi:hypothetical protein